jgi:outer membrane protein OmpA-like peptidoglycan-associated protein
MPAPPPKPPPPKLGFARPLDLGQDLARSLARADWPRAGELAAAGAGDPALAAQSTMVFENLGKLGYQIAPPGEVEVIGQIDRFTRLAIPLMREGGDRLNLQVDVEPDGSMGWKIAQFQIPPNLKNELASMAAANTAAERAKPAAPAPAGDSPEKPAAAATAGQAAEPAPGKTGMSAPSAGLPAIFQTTEVADVLTHASEFVQLLLAQNFADARPYLDETRVTAERMAGLCIVFEEGQYNLLNQKPLIITATVGDASWVVVKVRSDKLSQDTEFGIELQREGEGKPWRVVGLNLSDILGSFARSASQIGIPYTPIVKNPKGGESLALYFEYDEAGLHPRAQKQLQIVADLLKSDANRRVRVAGHTDALGDDSYNLRLSRERAESVKKELVALGVPPSQVDTTGLGKDQPLSPNQKSDGTDDPEGRSRNRRAEMYLDF